MLYSDMESALKTAEKEIDRLAAELADARGLHAAADSKCMELFFRNAGLQDELAEARETSVEIRRNEDETLDEIVGKNVFVHLEQLDVDRWFLDIGGVILDLFHPKGGHVKAVILDQPDNIDGKGE
jgi:hypothetical protein